GGKLKVPLVLRAPVGATTRGAQHAQSPYGFFCHVPGWKVAAPSDAYSAKGLLKAALRDDNPVLLFEHKLLYGSKGRESAGGLELTCEVPSEDYTIPLGKAKIKKEGSHATVVATHLMLYRCLKVARELEEEGLSLEVIDPQSLIPLDKETIYSSLAKTGRLAIVEEDTLTCGWGAELAALVAQEALYHLEAPILRIATPDVPIPFAPHLEKEVIPSEERIKKEIKSLC
ncbi:alpha-ketoacid dehydrogenase subunit beta, partial [Candidatus Hakubella thermalkaliphila]|uniref:alpha-ketoacid dehydrogenase subunit beta n=1 Tax=Candidatus Hakubella thermalkaliphila TaxID=2754717 RepID=UPI0015942C84